jgi:Domain of unknown function (DUF3943)
MRKEHILILSALLIITFTPVYSQTSLGNVFVRNSIHSYLSREFISSSSTQPMNGNTFIYNFRSWKDTLPHAGKDTLSLPHKNYLRNDDPDFNKRYPLWIPVAEIPGINGLIWSFDRFILKDSFAYINGKTIKNNFTNGWEWDTDDFPTNFSLHPYTGSLYFNAARSNGYNFYQSVPFVMGGSLMWEMCMENTKPSYNDVINTTISGVFIGEILYRLSSTILDDRKKGAARVLREGIATIIDPVRGFNRLLQGKTSRTVNKEIYQKEPLFLTTSGGMSRANGTNNGSNNIKPMLSFDFNYGDPFEVRFRKPYDFFNVRADFIFGTSGSVVNSVIGNGFLFGKNVDSTRKIQMLIGGFQYYDYWNTDSFQIGTIGLGGGLISRIPVFHTGNFQNQFH